MRGEAESVNWREIAEKQAEQLFDLSFLCQTLIRLLSQHDSALADQVEAQRYSITGGQYDRTEDCVI